MYINYLSKRVGIDEGKVGGDRVRYWNIMERIMTSEDLPTL